MKKIIVIIAMLFSIALHAQEKPVIPGIVPIPVKGTANPNDYFGRWLSYDKNYYFYSKLSQVNLQKAIDQYKLLLFANGYEKDSYDDHSIFPKDTDQTDMEAMYIDIILEKGELHYIHSKGLWTYSLTSDAEKKWLSIWVTKSDRLKTQ